MIQQHRSRSHWTAFFLALAMAAVMFLPFVIMDKGCFFYYGDFNVQQIPFYRLCHDAVRSGDIFWNWNTDLGANFIGSYSFYLLFSPFFWLTLPFPTEAIPYLIAPLLVLKFATAAFTSCLYIRRFVKEDSTAVLGSLLYAFSGYMIYNVFFNHFLEVVAFFPLLLVALEELMVNNRRGVFALAVAFNAIVNYWFFIGEVVFVVIYFFVRCISPQWKRPFLGFCKVAFEALLGVGLAMAVLLPSALAILGNPRTGTEKLLSGWSLWLYGHNQRLPAIIHSIFFPPDPPALSNFFPDHGAKWSSLSAYLPLFGAAGAISWCSARKKNWLKKMLFISLCMALVPGLNALFILLNNSYYARWFYMPVLLMALATALALEDENLDWGPGVGVSAAVVLIITLAVGLTPVKDSDTGSYSLGLYKYGALYLLSVILVMAALVALLLLLRVRQKPFFRKAVAYTLVPACLLLGLGEISAGRVAYPNTQWIAETALPGRDVLSIPQEEGTFARSDFYKANDNLGMYWFLPNIQAFHSIIPVSIMEFYPTVGVKRDVSSKPDTKYYPLRSLLSVRWLFISETEENQAPMPGYTYFDTQLGYNIYENDNYLPMGFGYEYYVTREQYESVATDMRCRLLLRAVVLDDEAIERCSDILLPLPEEEFTNLSDDQYLMDVEARRAMSALSFEKDNTGFTSMLNLEDERLIFYSVPYDAGWSVTVNGQPAQIERASIGFMAVRVPAGESVVRFTYRTPGLRIGLWITGGSLVVLLVYLLIWRLTGGRRRPAAVHAPAPAQAPIPLAQMESREVLTGGHPPKESLPPKTPPAPRPPQDPHPGALADEPPKAPSPQGDRQPDQAPSAPEAPPESSAPAPDGGEDAPSLAQAMERARRQLDAPHP